MIKAFAFSLATSIVTPAYAEDAYLKDLAALNYVVASAEISLVDSESQHLELVLVLTKGSSVFVCKADVVIKLMIMSKRIDTLENASSNKYRVCADLTGAGIVRE